MARYTSREKVAMIADFIASWSLFENAYLSGLFLAVALPLLGTVIVARNQVFIGAAISQSSALGIACGLLFAPESGHAAAIVCGILAAVAASLLCRVPWNSGSGEARSGWIFLCAGSFSVVLLSQSPIGREEIARLLSSSILGATRGEMYFVALIALLTVAAVTYFHRGVVLYLIDPVNARAIGVPIDRIELAVSLWLGFVVGVAMKLTGLLFTFGLLLLPVMVSAHLVGTVAAVLLGAPFVAVIAVLLAYVGANRWDLPPGQAATALLSVLVIPSSLFALWRARTRPLTKIQINHSVAVER